MSDLENFITKGIFLSQPQGLESLPNELLVQILRDATVYDLVRFSGINHFWSALSNLPTLWEAIVQHFFLESPYVELKISSPSDLCSRRKALIDQAKRHESWRRGTYCKASWKTAFSALALDRAFRQKIWITSKGSVFLGLRNLYSWKIANEAELVFQDSSDEFAGTITGVSNDYVLVSQRSRIPGCCTIKVEYHFLKKVYL